MKLLTKLSLAPLVIVGSLATPVARQTSPPPQVTTTIYPDGQPVSIVGISNSTLGVDEYSSIPYAKPPTGDLRFAPPESPCYAPDTPILATQTPPACLQNLTGGMGGIQNANISEDCLFLDIVTPSGQKDSNGAKLPVVIQIHGGGFTSGGNIIYPGAPLVLNSLMAKVPVIYVAVQYRLGIFGFPSGQVFEDNGATNLGLRDQIKAVEWVKEHIWAFGGDPDKITMWGESAGGICIGLHYINPHLQDKDLFRAGVLMSGSPSSAEAKPTTNINPMMYDALLQLSNCTENTFDCLKGLGGEELLNASLASGFHWQPTLDGDIIPASAHDLLVQGKFLNIPTIGGTVKDEYVLMDTISSLTSRGTFFNIPGLSIGFAEYFQRRTQCSNATIAELQVLYPNIPALGSPFDTGNETFGLPPDYKQWSAITGDTEFVAPKRDFLKQLSCHGQDRLWSYAFDQNVVSPVYPPELGVEHALDVPFIYGYTQGDSLGVNFTKHDTGLSIQMMDYYLRFTTYLDPNGPCKSQSDNATLNSTFVEWPKWDPTNRKLINFTSKGDGISIRKDDFRENQTDWILEHYTEFSL